MDRERSLEVIAEELSARTRELIKSGRLTPDELSEFLDAKEQAGQPKELGQSTLEPEVVEILRRLPPYIELTGVNSAEQTTGKIEGKWDDHGKFHVHSLRISESLYGEDFESLPPEVISKMQQLGHGLHENSQHEVLFTCDWGADESQWPAISPSFLTKRQAMRPNLFPPVSIESFKFTPYSYGKKSSIVVVARPAK